MSRSHTRQRKNAKRKAARAAGLRREREGRIRAHEDRRRADRPTDQRFLRNGRAVQ